MLKICNIGVGALLANDSNGVYEHRITNDYHTYRLCRTDTTQNLSVSTYL